SRSVVHCGTAGTDGASGTFGPEPRVCRIGATGFSDSPEISRSTGGSQPGAKIDRALSRLPAAASRDHALLLDATRRFVNSPWLEVAARSGWTLKELFGLDNSDPQDASIWGLVVGLALAPRLGDIIQSIDGQRAVIGFRNKSH